VKRDYYILKGERLARKDNTLRLYYSDGEFKDLPIEKINQLNVFCEMNLNSSFLNFAMRNEITINFFNYYGYYTGSFYPREKRVSGQLLISQVKNSVDGESRLKIAQKFIEGASYNVFRNLRYYQERGHNIELAQIKAMRNKISTAKSIQGLMGIEGNIRRTYYNNWNGIINDEFQFEKRTKMPPENPINCLISLLNTMLYTVTISEIYKTHLDPSISYLHEPGERRFSLALDISEIFKPLIVDRIIFSMINKREINVSDFEENTNGILMKEVCKKKMLKAFNDRLEQKITHNKLKKRSSYRNLIRLELLKLEKYLLVGEEYSPFKLEW